MFLIGDSETAASYGTPTFRLAFSLIIITFQEIGEIDKEFPIVGRLIVLSVVLAFNPCTFQFSEIPRDY